MQTPIASPTSMRPFTLIWLGQLVSMVGSGLTNFALGVWIYNQTGAVTPFALTALFSILPAVLVSPLAGALVDRWNRRTVLILADTGSALSTLVAALLLLSGQLEIWHIYLVVFVSSLCSAFQEPAYTASITLLVPKKELARASGMGQTALAISSLIAPVLAGLLFAPLGAGGIMLLDFATFFVAIAALLFVPIPQPAAAPRTEQDEKPSLLREATFGWHYIAARSGFMGMLIYFALVNFLLNVSAILIAPLILSISTSAALGLVEAVSGAGLMAGGILMSLWRGPKRRIMGVYGALALAAVGLLIGGVQTSVFWIAAGFTLLRFCIPFSSGYSQAIWQSKVEPALQGRVFATRSMISRSIMPFAFLIAGPLADRIFEPLMSTGGALASASLFGLRLGGLLGEGTGRGVGLIFILSGLLLLGATALAFAHPRIRNMETELPDAVPDHTEPDSTSDPNATPRGELSEIALASAA